MEELKKIASEILEYSKMIYLIQEDLNPEVIFGDKRFRVDVKDGRENIKVKKDYEEKDTHYHFETSKIRGIITKKESGNYSIKARVKYKNDNNIELDITYKNNKNIYFRFMPDLKLHITCNKFITKKEIAYMMF